MAAAVATVGARQQEIRITQEVMTTNPLGGPGPGGGLNPIPQGTGLILGQIVDAGSSRPVPGALVTLGLPGSRPIRALADGQGRFVFRDLPKGRFNLTVTKAGFVDGAYGRMRPAGPTLPFDLTDGERASGVSMTIWRYSALGGTVLDEQGEPVVGATVRVLRRQILGGQWRLVPGAQDLTDDRGVYRIGTLEPGEYVVAVPMGPGSNRVDGLMPMVDGQRDVVVSVAAVRVAAATGGEGAIFIEGSGGNDAAGVGEDGKPLTYPTTFYPASPSAARATIAKLGAGEERTNLDFQLRPVRALQVSGTAIGPEGPMANLALTLVPVEADSLASALDTRTAFSNAGGAFTFQAVPPGQYTLRATRTPRIAFGAGEATVIQQGGATIMTRTATVTGAPPLPTEPTLWAESPVAVGAADVTDLSVLLRPGIRVTGIVQFDGAAARPESTQLSSIAVTLEPADVRPGGAGTVRGRIEASGQFATMGVPAGRYFVRVAGAPQGWTFRGATQGGRDVTDTPMELESGDVSGITLVFTDRPIVLSGQVQADGGSPEGASVIVFPTDQNAWVGYGSAARRLRNVRADKTGAYTVPNLPAGEYFVAAVSDKMAADWQNPEFLASLTGDAVRVRLSDGQRATQNVKVAR
jgi:hypothetical protein